MVNWGQVYIPKTSEISSFLDLDGKKIAVVKRDIYYQFFKEVGEKFNIKPVFLELDEYADILKAIDRGGADDITILGMSYFGNI